MPVTPYMNLTLPTPTVSPGPEYATTLNNAFTGVDSHNHTPGFGVPIPTAGISINADLNFAGFNAYALRSSKYTSQSAPLALAGDLNSVFVSGGNLYYNNNIGQHVQITAGSGINISGTTGIGGDYASSGASVFYTLATLLYSFTNFGGSFAAMKSGAATIVNAGGFGPTLTSPLALASNYTLTLFNGAPAAIKIVTLDASGNLGAAYDVDNTTLEVSANLIQLKNGGVSTAKLADGSVTNPKLAALGQQVSSSSSTFTSASTTYVDVTNLTVTIVTTGRPVRIFLNPSGSASAIGPSSASLDAAIQSFVALLRDGSVIYEQTMYIAAHAASGAGVASVLPVSCISFMDIPTAASHVYKIQVKTNNIVGTGSTEVTNAVLVAYEL